MAMPFADLADVKIYYEWAGQESLPVLVFSNGLGTNVHLWDGQVEAFSKHFRILRYDVRGHGQSAVTPGPYTLAQLSRDLVHLIDFLKLDRVDFCGLSMGGMTGMFLGANAANRFHKLVLCNTASKFSSEDMWNKRIEAVERGGMKEVAGSILERWLTQAFRSAHPAETQAVLSMLESANPEGYAACCSAVRDTDLRNTLKDIHLPSLVLTGTHDPAATPAASMVLAKSIPGAVYAELPASHISNVEARTQFTQQVLEFLLA
jgi:3-oxoadipate enol-lactonase